MYLTVTIAHFAVSFGLSFYSSYVLEHQYGMSRQSIGRWLSRYLLRVSLTIGFGLLVILGLYTIIWTTLAWWWLVAAATFFLVSVIVGQLFPVVILPLFHKSERLDDPTLMNRFHQLVEGTGLSIEGVYRLEVSNDTAKANAQLAGIGSTRRALMDDTLLENFDEDELAVIFAHEVGHHVHRHIPKLVAMGVISSLVIFLGVDRVMAHWITTLEGSLDYRNFPIYALPMFSLLMAIASLLLQPLQNSLSRHFERQADRYALRATGLRDAFRSAFMKLAKLNKAMLDPPALEVFLFHSHPTIAERLKAAEAPTTTSS
jgi:STE24 endopeptidase